MSRTFIDLLFPGRRERAGRRFDRRHGVETNQTLAANLLTGMTADLRQHAGDYVPTNPRLFGRIVHQSGVDPQDFTFVDLGCGKGRTLVAAADYSFREIIGVEADAGLYRTAVANLQRWRGRNRAPNIRIVHADARAADLPPGNLFIYMYSPFRGRIFEDVATRLAAAAADPDRAVVIAYSSDWEAASLERTGAFVRVRMRRRQFWARPTISFFYNRHAAAMRRERPMLIGRSSRLGQLSPERRRLLVRAITTLAESSAVVALLPFRRAVAFGSAALAAKQTGPTVGDVVWAVEAAARRVPWRAMCIERGLATQRLLRQSGVEARLHYGARHEEGSGKLQAHVWVSVEGEPVIGGDEAADYQEMAVFP